MSSNPTVMITTPAPTEERHATAHTAVLIPAMRDETGLKSGLVSADMANRRGEFPHWTLDMGSVTKEKMRLGNELPYYEVSFRGKLYRTLARPRAGLDSTTPYFEKFELIRTWAPGLTSDGWHQEAPATVPNTPRALVEALQPLVEADLDEIVASAYSIFHYRLANKAKYPETMVPAGFTFRELFLMSVDTEGKLVTHYETPRGTNVELWTMFLRALDRGERTKLVPYAHSSMAIKEFGEGGAQAMLEALRLRDGLQRESSMQMHGKRFLEVFPFSHSIPRDVTQLAGSW